MALYVSRAVLAAGDAEQEVGEIVARARTRNRRLSLTGALIFTGHHFAQLLEGPEAGVDEIMSAIRRDPRHHSLHSSEEAIERRSFQQWSLAYSGPSTYVDRRIRRLFAAAEARPDSPARAELHELMQVLVETLGGASEG